MGPGWEGVMTSHAHAAAKPIIAIRPDWISWTLGLGADGGWVGLGLVWLGELVGTGLWCRHPHSLQQQKLLALLAKAAPHRVNAGRRGVTSYAGA